MAWPFRDAPRSAPSADAPCVDDVRTRRRGVVKGGRGGRGSGAEGDRLDRE